MFKLGVNIDHIATLRQIRLATFPDLVEAAAICERAGAHGITLHLREDRRHIQDADLYTLRQTIKTRMNIEIGNFPDIVDIALEIKPEELCLVPERREELTTEGGLDVVRYFDELQPTVAKMKGVGSAVSMFIDPDPEQVKASAEIGADYIELHTGTYVKLTGADQIRELERLHLAAAQAYELGLRVNAGHGLSVENVAPILDLPHLDTLNIGHAIICHAVFVGLDAAVRAMLEKMGN